MSETDLSSVNSSYKNSSTRKSVQFHESGKKHQENVRKRLSEMQKKATKDAAAAAIVETQMQKMEKAAMKAYLKDIESNPDYTSQKIKETLDAARAGDSTSYEKKQSSREQSSQQAAPPEKKWMEAKSDQGYSYYWNIETGETAWEPPKEGFLSLDDQNKPVEEKKKIAKQPPIIKKEKTVSDLNREIYGASRVPPVKEEPEEPIQGAAGPSPRSQPYGSWTAVVKEEETPAEDLQLPYVACPSDSIPSIPMPEEKKRTFKERKAPVSSVDPEACSVQFKKRKFGGARNARQRGGDD